MNHHQGKLFFLNLFSSDDEEGQMIRSGGSNPVVGGISIYYYAGIINKSEIN